MNDEQLRNAAIALGLDTHKRAAALKSLLTTTVSSLSLAEKDKTGVSLMFCRINIAAVVSL
jgi:hypothetical protein